MELPFVSVIIPCFNEEKFIGTVLDNLLHQDYPAERVEIFAIDGNSGDKTREIIRSYATKYPVIQLLINERQFISFALNLGISKAKGEFIIIIGSHSEYPLNYISSLVKASMSLDADNVGGLCIAKPPDNTLKAIAVSKALSSSFGVGNAWFRIGSKEIKKVDTVTFGCYKRSVFNRIGLFDEELLRNQDDEFNARLVKNGGSIYLIPGISVTYFTRKTISAVIRMFYQYGLFKPLVSYKIGKPTTIRQLVPFCFVMFLLITTMGTFLTFWSAIALMCGLSLYLVTDLLFSFKIAKESRNYQLLFILPWLFFLIHFAYGWGYLAGIIKFIILRQQKKTIGTTR